MPAKLVVGLGNPGEEFEGTRHNIGFGLIDFLAERLEIKLKHEKKKSTFGKKKFNGQEFILLKPQTFANLSGEAVLYIASFLKVNIEDILVAYDDIDVNFGQIKILKPDHEVKHNAVNNLQVALKSEEFHKLAFGVGPGPKYDSELEDFYLGSFSAKEEPRVEEVFEKSLPLIADFFKIEF